MPRQVFARIEDVRAAQWVLREAGSGTRSEFEDALQGRGIPPSSLNVTLELPSNEALLSAVVAGAGACALSESVVAGALRTGDLACVRFDLPARDFRVLRHKERYRSRAADALLDLIREASG